MNKKVILCVDIGACLAVIVAIFANINLPMTYTKVSTTTTQTTKANPAKRFTKERQRLDPAINLTLSASHYYKKGNYDKAEELAKKAVATAYE